MNSRSRRRFLIRIMEASAAALLTGCDRLSQSTAFVRVLGSAESANERLHRLLAEQGASAPVYSEADISLAFPVNGTAHPDHSAYRALAENGFSDWRLDVVGLVRRPAQYSLTALKQLDAGTQITRFDCVEGWSAIAKWRGVPLHSVLDLVQPLPEARYAVFHCADQMAGSNDRYYESLDLEMATHPQTLLAYELNDEALSIGHGAPLRLRVEKQLGYKSAKYLMKIELVSSLAGIGGGRGGYWEDRGYEWYAGI